MPSSKPKLTTSPRDAFLNLLMLVMMYLSVISVIAISFAYIDFLLPDRLSFYLEGTLRSIRWGSSMLIVAFPLFLFLVRVIYNGFRREPDKHNLRFRKWLVYLTLFVAAITIVIDLVQLVFRFYDGDLTLPFTLKVVSILLVAGAVFGYFMWDVQSKPYESPIPKRVAFVSGLIFVVLLVSGFLIVGTPAKQRMLNMDLKRVEHLWNLHNSVVSYRSFNGELPVTLEVMEIERGGEVPIDPENGSSYEYSLKEGGFEICATFDLDSLDKGGVLYDSLVGPSFEGRGEMAREYYAVPIKPYGEGCYDSFCVTPVVKDFKHGPGRNCFEFEIIERSQ